MTDDNPLSLLRNIVAREGIQWVANKLLVGKGTLNNWVIHGKIPQEFVNDLRSLNGLPPVITDARANGQYYTSDKIARQCRDWFISYLDAHGLAHRESYTWLEPSAGAGAFFNLMPKNARVGLDIAPHATGVEQADYLAWKPTDNRKWLILGNPPFGRNGILALKFINHSLFADYIGFILPPTFAPRINYTGVVNKLNGWILDEVHDIPLGDGSYLYPDGKPTAVKTIFCIFRHCTRGEKAGFGSGILVSGNESKASSSSFVDVVPVHSEKYESNMLFNPVSDYDFYVSQYAFTGGKATLTKDPSKIQGKYGFGVKLRCHRELLPIIEAFDWNDWKKAGRLASGGQYNITAITLRDFLNSTIKELIERDTARD